MNNCKITVVKFLNSLKVTVPKVIPASDVYNCSPKKFTLLTLDTALCSKIFEKMKVILLYWFAPEKRVYASFRG